jgi:pSer/pThr/pTyr-binding forkhead associated (FHA) protein
MTVTLLRITISEGVGAGRVIDVDRELTVGREEGGDVVLPDPQLSGRHALLRPVDGAIELVDLGSADGTWVDGVRLTGPRRLTGGEEVRLGSTVLRVEPQGEGGPHSIFAEPPPAPAESAAHSIFHAPTPPTTG